LEAVMLSGTRLRGIALQVAALLGFCTLVIGAAITAWTRMQEQGMAYGFGVLMRPTEWDVSSILAEQTISDPYWWTLCVALANTILVSIVGIILATIVGFSIGVLRHAGNPLLSKVLGVYVETFRNIPLLLQLVFWYTTFTQLPPAREAISLGPDIWLANAGLYFPAFFLMGNGWLALVVMILGLALTVWGISVFLRRPRPRGHSQKPMAHWHLPCCRHVLFSGDAPVADVRGAGTGTLQPDGRVCDADRALCAGLLDHCLLLVLHCRGRPRGLQSVPKGLWEASDAMALSKSQAYVYVTLPVALRSILPSLGNQYVFVVKSTALGIAVGFSDIFSVSVVAITQTGQTIEFLAILMGIYLVLNYALTSVLNLANRRLSLTRR
jgi:general L-amino acid transport system permease protein